MAKTLDAAGVKRLIQEIKGANKNLNAPIPISTENTPESMAQNVKNIADYVAKAKAAGIANVDGMGVTCIIDGSYSGVGYLYGDTDTSICGIEIFDDSTSPMYFKVDPDGTYGEVAIIMENNTDIVTSDMLVEGARKPIILTPDTTEVDEETYQKLSQEGTDVILSFGGGTFLDLQGIFNMGDTLNLIFGYSQFDESNDGVIATYTISINTSAPHTLTLAAIGLYEPVSKSTLSPVLQEIDLTGTDAERKAKLDQFETDWKALTGADDLTGARFVGRVPMSEEGSDTLVLLNYDIDDRYSGISMTDFDESALKKVTVNPSDGSIQVTPLFSHLEAITIYTDNTPEHKQANLDNIAAYEANLQALGVDTTKGWNAPVAFSNRDSGILSYLVGDYYLGIQFNNNNVTSPYSFNIRKSDGYFYRTNIITQATTISSLTTTSKQIVGAINEINANAVHSDKLVPTLEAITIYTDNTPEHKQANLDNIAAYEANLQALGVDVTKGYMIPITASGRNGFLSTRRGDYPYAGYAASDSSVNEFYNILILGNGEYYDSKIQLEISNDLTTTSKQIVGAINEVNALAKGYSTIFTPIELTTETAQNKTAIDARVAAFTAQGISLTNGCCIPVTYKGVYAGNISLINGDWYGLLVKNTNNPADNINIKLSADGTITEGNSAQ